MRILQVQVVKAEKTDPAELLTDRGLQCVRTWGCRLQEVTLPHSARFSPQAVVNCALSLQHRAPSTLFRLDSGVPEHRQAMKHELYQRLRIVTSQKPRESGGRSKKRGLRIVCLADDEDYVGCTMLSLKRGAPSSVVM